MIKIDWNTFKTKFLDKRVCYLKDGDKYFLWINLGFGIFYKIVNKLYMVAIKDNDGNVINSYYRYRISSGNSVFNIPVGTYFVFEYNNVGNSDLDISFYINYWK